MSKKVYYTIEHPDGRKLYRHTLFPGRLYVNCGPAGETMELVICDTFDQAEDLCERTNEVWSGFVVKKHEKIDKISKTEMPKLYFHELKTRTKEELDAFKEKYFLYSFVVYMRTKYSYEDESEWEYSYQLLLCDGFIGDVVHYVWEKDWDEGQECVEYLGVAVIDMEENEKIGKEREND